MELSDSSLSVNIAGITVHAKYFGLALINNHLAFRGSRQAGENPASASPSDEEPSTKTTKTN